MEARPKVARDDDDRDRTEGITRTCNHEGERGEAEKHHYHFSIEALIAHEQAILSRVPQK